MRRLLLALPLLLAACASVPAIPQADRQPMAPVEVAAAGTRAEVFRRVVAAFTAEGLTVEHASADGGLVTSATLAGDIVTHASGLAGGLFPQVWRTHTRYRAVVLGDDGAVRVQVTATSAVEDVQKQTMSPEAATPEACARDPKCVEAIISRMHRIAARIPGR
jgi:hypothetical protein